MKHALKMHVPVCQQSHFCPDYTRHLPKLHGSPPSEYTLNKLYWKFFHRSGFLSNLRLPWKTEFVLKFSMILNIFFAPFWIFEQLCACLEKQSWPWNTSLYWISLLHSGFLSNLRSPWKIECALNSLYWIYIFYHSGILSNLRLPWKIEFALKFFTVLNIFLLFRNSTV